MYTVRLSAGPGPTLLLHTMFKFQIPPRAPTHVVHDARSFLLRQRHACLGVAQGLLPGQPPCCRGAWAPRFTQTAALGQAAASSPARTSAPLRASSYAAPSYDRELSGDACTRCESSRPIAQTRLEHGRGARAQHARCHSRGHTARPLAHYAETSKQSAWCECRVLCSRPNHGTPCANARHDWVARARRRGQPRATSPAGTRTTLTRRPGHWPVLPRPSAERGAVEHETVAVAVEQPRLGLNHVALKRCARAREREPGRITAVDVEARGTRDITCQLARWRIHERADSDGPFASRARIYGAQVDVPRGEIHLKGVVCTLHCAVCTVQDMDIGKTAGHKPSQLLAASGAILRKGRAAPVPTSAELGRKRSKLLTALHAPQSPRQGCCRRAAARKRFASSPPGSSNLTGVHTRNPAFCSRGLSGLGPAVAPPPNVVSCSPKPPLASPSP